MAVIIGWLAAAASLLLPHAPRPRARIRLATDDGTDYYSLRFQGTSRLFGGADAASRLNASKVVAVGLGGVGSWAVEALARSGVGSLVLIDLDEICISNTNRQLHALRGTVGKSKAAVLAARIGESVARALVSAAGSAAPPRRSKPERSERQSEKACRARCCLTSASSTLGMRERPPACGWRPRMPSAS